MNENFDTKEYLKTLPKPIQDFVSSGNWEVRVNEISKKYSLDANQSEDLLNIVLLTLILITRPEDMKQTITQDLNISGLLVDQIVSDLESRVFEYITKQMEPKETPVVNPGLNPGLNTAKPIANQIHNSIPEIRPKMSPAPINLPTGNIETPKTAFLYEYPRRSTKLPSTSFILRSCKISINIEYQTKSVIFNQHK